MLASKVRLTKKRDKFHFILFKLNTKIRPLRIIQDLAHLRARVMTKLAHSKDSVFLEYSRQIPTRAEYLALPDRQLFDLQELLTNA